MPVPFIIVALCLASKDDGLHIQSDARLLFVLKKSIHSGGKCSLNIRLLNFQQYSLSCASSVVTIQRILKCFAVAAPYTGICCIAVGHEAVRAADGLTDCATVRVRYSTDFPFSLFRIVTSLTEQALYVY